MPSILFVVPQTRSIDGTRLPPSWPYIGVAYLAAHLKPAGVEVSVIDLAIAEDTVTAIRGAVGNRLPDLIGLTVFTPLVKDAREIVPLIRQACPNVPLVVGGPHISTAKQEFLAETGAEFGILSDGERPLAMLLDAISRKAGEAELLSIPGLIFRRKGGEFSIKENTALTEDLDQIPFPDWTVFDLAKYPQWVEKTNYGLITSRGCPHQCTYCAAPCVTGRRFRKRSAENVLAEIARYYDDGFRRFSVMDDAFNIDIERAKKICRLMIDRNYRITWDMGNGIRANAVDAELAGLLRRSGCNFVGLGMESGNDEVLKKIKKGLTISQMRTALDLLGREGIGTAVNFIVGHPDDTYETAMDTVRLAATINASYSNIYNLIPLKGTEAYEQITAMAKKGQATFLYDYDYYVSHIFAVDIEPVYETPSFTRDQRRKVLRAARNITKRRALQYRFGVFFGGILYLLIRNHRAFRFATTLANTHVGKKIYARLRRE